MADGLLAYFPAALAGVARVSKQGNDKHNPGEPLHHARGKSRDHANCIVRHLVDVQDLVSWLSRHSLESATVAGWPEAYAVQAPRNKYALLEEVSYLAWRALALSQELHEKYGGAPMAPGARE